MNEAATRKPVTVEQVRNDIKDAMKAREAGRDRLRVLRFVMAKAADKAKARPNPADREATDADVLAAIQTQVKETREKIALVESHGGVADPADRHDIAFLETYLPERMDEASLTRTIAAILAETEDRSDKVRGFVNKTLRDRHQGQYDNAQVALILNGILKK
jgi:uncharacterized protein YqeY